MNLGIFPMTHVEALAVVSSRGLITYRAAKSSDVTGIAKLLTETFEGEDIPSWNVLQRALKQDRYKQSLKKRLDMPQHAMIVAISEDDKIAGFMELGTLPSPVPVVITWNGVETQKRPEMPYLANLAVDKDFRRQKIGTELVRLALKIACKWMEESDGGDDDVGASNNNAAMYLSVEKENAAAVQFYEVRLNFARIIDETEKLSKEQQQKLQRKPRFYFEKKLFSRDKDTAP